MPSCAVPYRTAVPYRPEHCRAEPYQTETEAAGETVGETVGETAGETAGETVSETVGETLSETVCESVCETVCETVGEADAESETETTAVLCRIVPYRAVPYGTVYRVRLLSI